MFAGARPLQRWLRIVFAVALCFPSGLMAASGSSIINVSVCSTIFAPVSLSTTTPSPTISASASLSGTAQPLASLSITVNSLPVASLVVAGDGTYSANVPLNPGTNQIVAHASDSCGNTADSSTLTIVRTTVSPGVPSITTPGNGAIVHSSPVVVSGSGEPSATIKLYRNNLLVATTTADLGGSFSTSIGLAAGINSLHATATNGIGTSGPSAPVVVTYIPPVPPAVSTPPGYSPPGLTGGQGPPAPTITAPSSGSVTSEPSVDVAVTSVAGATVRIYRGNAEIASTIADSSGNAALTIALSPGLNDLYATASAQGRTSAHSNQVSVTYQQSPPPSPQILHPANHSTVTHAGVVVSGTASPGLQVHIVRSGRELAWVTAADDGTFSVLVTLKEGANSLVASVKNDFGESLSSPVDVYYSNPKAGIGASGRGIGERLKDLAGVVLGVGGMALHAYQDILRANAGSPVLVTAALLAALLATLLTQGLIGVQEMWLLLTSFTRRLLGLFVGGRKVTGRVFNHLTGHAISLAAVYTEVGKRYGISGFSGKFHLKLSDKDAAVMAKHPGYSLAAPGGVTSESTSIVVEMTPEPALKTLGSWVIDFDLGIVGWGMLLYGWSLSLYLATHTTSVITSAICVLFSTAILMSLYLLIAHPRIQWGKVVDADGNGYEGVVVKLLDRAKGTVLQTTLTSKKGRYTLFAGVGEYDIQAELPSGEKLQAAVTITKKPAYFGYRLQPNTP